MLECVCVCVCVCVAGEYAEQVYEALSGYSRDYGSLMTTPHWQTIIWAARQVRTCPHTQTACSMDAVLQLGRCLAAHTD